MKQLRYKIQRGYTLMVSLIFMIILTIIGVMSTDSTTFEVRMALNTQLKAQSLECSERLRNVIAELLESHAENSGWPEALGGEVSDGMFPNAIDGDVHVYGRVEGDLKEPSLTDHYVSNYSKGDGSVNSDVSSESLLNGDTLRNDVALLNDQQDVMATASIYRVTQRALPGFGVGQNTDYKGFGFGSAGAVAIYYHLRSVSEDKCSMFDTAKTHASTITESEYRLVPIFN